MIRVFAPEDDSACKYALIFRGISVNWGEKIENRLQIESCRYRFLSTERKSTDQSAIPQYSVKTDSRLDFIWHVSVRSEAYFFFSLAVS